MPQLLALAPIAALAALVRTHRQGTYSRATIAWAAFPVLLLVALAGLALAGLLEGFYFVSLPITSLVLWECAHLTLTREERWRTHAALEVRTRRRHEAVFAFVLVVLCELLVELPFNDLFGGDGPRYIPLEMLLIAFLLAALYFLGQRRAVCCLPAVALFALAGFAQHFVARFKNSAILPTDLLVLDTAAAVTGEYVFSFNDQTLLGVMALALVVCALSLVPSPTSQTYGLPLPQNHPVARNLIASLISFAALVALVLVPDYMGQLGVEMRYWYSIDCYKQQGFFPSFIAVAQDMPIRKPKGYTDEKAVELERAYAQAWHDAAASDEARVAAEKQFAEQQPSVIVVMNESFCDLSKYDGMHAGYKGPTYFQTGFDDALAKGTLDVSVHGAGTCNTEFEFLTGNSLSFIGAGKYPYSIYDLASVDSLPAQFASLGYHTLAMHPNYGSNWKRDRIYPQMGFDEFWSIEHFGGKPDMTVDTQTPEEPHCEAFHSGVSDAATYDMIVELLESDKRPQFVFDVTMANHGSYDQNNIPAPYRTNYQPADYVGEETSERLNEFLGCIAKSDDDLRAFVSDLRKLDRPVVLVFFGDHQPTLSASYNDYWYKGEPEDVHARRAFSTDYVIWANYDVDGRDQSGKDDEISVDLLAAQTLDLIGAPLSDSQATLLSVREQIMALSADGYQMSDRTWHSSTEEGAASEAYRDLSLVEYLNFATKV